MNLNELEKDREREKRKRIQDSLKVVKLKKQIRGNNEKQLENKLGVQESLEIFHKPVTEELEKYEKSNKEVVKGIQNALDNISFPPLESPALDYSSDARNLMDRAEGILRFSSDKFLDHSVIQNEGLNLPSELFNKSEDELNEIIKKAKEKRDTYKRLKGTHSKNYKLSRNENDNEKMEEANYKMKTMAEYIKVLEIMKKSIPYMGEGIDKLELLIKLTDKICKSGKVSKQLHAEIVLLLDMLLQNGTMTEKDVKQYYDQFLH